MLCSREIPEVQIYKSSPAHQAVLALPVTKIVLGMQLATARAVKKSYRYPISCLLWAVVEVLGVGEADAGSHPFN